MQRPDCKARVAGQEYICTACGLRWDLNDDDPPMCRTTTGTLSLAEQNAVERNKRPMYRRERRYE